MPTEANDGYYEVVWPRSPRQIASKALAPRLQTLEDKTIAELWDYVYRGDEVYAWLEEALKARFPGVRFVNWREFGFIHGNEEREVLAALPQRLKQFGVDAAVSAMGC